MDELTSTRRIELLRRTVPLPRVSTERSLQALAHNFKRVMQIVGIVPLMQAMCA
jgi:hypothetical protein